MVNNCKSISEVIKHYGLVATGGNYHSFKERFKAFGIDTNHFIGQSWAKGVAPPTTHTKETFIDKVLKKGGKGWRSSAIREKLYFFGLREKECEKCGIKEWNGVDITLHLDHIDGDHSNNELSNLRILCPNCHSQTITYCGNKNKK